MAGDRHQICVRTISATLAFGLLLAVGLEAAGQGADQSQDQPPAAAVDPGRPVSWKLLTPNILSDQKNIWLYPFRKSETRKWVPMLLVGGITAGLIATDAREAHYFRASTTYHDFNSVFSGRNTALGIVEVPIALYGSGLISRDSKTRQTAMLAGQAAVDAELVTIALKDITRRQGPGAVTNNDFSNSWLKTSGSYWRGSGSFSSGHTATAFSVATVLARRYSQHKWVPYVAYGAAAAVGFSCLSLSGHYASDVFLGAALGYSISRFVVLRPE